MVVGPTFLPELILVAGFCRCEQEVAGTSDQFVQERGSGNYRLRTKEIQVGLYLFSFLYGKFLALRILIRRGRMKGLL